MGLSSVLSTAVTGLQASETTLDVSGNNIANANTIGFKASEAIFATQFLQTMSLGSAPTDTDGGTNPRQTGLGVLVAAIQPDFTQGTLEISAIPSDLAIQGDGLFIVQATGGEQLYTRNGKFTTNADNELVTITGDRLLGWGVDDNFQIQATTLVPLGIPLGSAIVAQPTEIVTLEGMLSPTGDLADTAEIIQSAPLGNATFTAPPAGTTATAAAIPNATTTTGTPGAGGALTPLGTYRYQVVFGDAPIGSFNDTESMPSQVIGPITLGAGEQQITLNNIPVDPAGNYQTRRIYRTADGGTTYQLVTEIPDNTTTSFVDTVADGALGAALDTSSLNGNYSYYVTYADAVGGPGSGIESRPTPIIGPLNTVNGRIQLDNLPVDGSGQWTVRRIYRNLASNPSEFHFVAEVPNNLAGVTYTDNASDATISANAEINLAGPPVTASTLLTDVLQQQSNGVATPVFEPGTLTFEGRKGGRLLGEKQLEITAATTVLDLVNFMQEALGIQTIPGPDPLNPVPTDSSGASPGGFITANGELRFVGNNGVDNAIDISGSNFTLTTATGSSPIALNFDSVQSAVGQSAVADFVAYDSLGIPLNVRLTAVLESRTDTQSNYRWFATTPQNDPVTGVATTVGTGLVSFDGEGKLISSTNTTVSVARDTIPSNSPLEFELDFSQVSGLAAENSSLAATRQDGFPPGTLTSYIIGEDGIIRGVFDNGSQRDLGQIRLARFANPQGLVQRGQNLFSAGINSGLPIEGNPGEQGIGGIIAGAVEQSNTDIGENLIDLILASTQYRGSTRVITAAQQLLDELMNLRR